MSVKVTESKLSNMLTFELSVPQIQFFNSYCRSATTGEILGNHVDDTLTFDIKDGGRVVLPILEIVIATDVNTKATTLGFYVNTKTYPTLFKELQSTPNTHYRLAIKHIRVNDTPVLSFSAKAVIQDDVR